MKKHIKNGKVGILISPDYGAGWSTWNPECRDEMIFSPEIIELVERKASFEEIEAKAKELFGKDAFLDGARGLTVEYLPIGTPFVIRVHDGAESIETAEDLILIA